MTRNRSGAFVPLKVGRGACEKDSLSSSSATAGSAGLLNPVTLKGANADTTGL